MPNFPPMLVLILTANVIVAALLWWYLRGFLRRMKKRYHALQENAGDAVVVIGANGKLVHASASVQKVLGYSVREIMRLDIGSLAHPDDVGALSEIMAQVMAQPGVPVKGHTGRMLHGDGSWHWYEAVVTNMLHDGDIRGIVDNFRDVTLTVQAQERTVNANRLYGFISQINQAIVQTAREDHLFEKTCRIAADFGSFKMVWVGLFSPDRTMVTLSKGCGISDGDLDMFANAQVWQGGPMSKVIETGASYVCNDISGFHHDLWRLFADSNGIGSFMVLPLSKSGEIIGTLNLYSVSPGLFSAQEITLLEEVAGDISFALNAMERERSRLSAEKRLRASELRLKQAQLIAHVGSFELDFSTGMSIWSEELCRIYGFSESDNVHPYMDWFSMVHPDDLQHVREVTALARETLQPSAIHHRIVLGDGSIRHIYSQGEYDLDIDGNPLGMHGVAHDITQFKESEGARYRSEQNLQLIMDLIPQGIFIKDIMGSYQFVNESFAALYGVSAAEFMGEAHPQYVELEGEREAFLSQDQQVILSGETLTIPELPFTDASGKTRYFYTVKVPYALSGDSVKGMLGIALEITAHKEAELERTRMLGDLQRRNKGLEQFSYVVSHNLRAPLANIMSLISLLDPPEGEGHSGQVHDALMVSTRRLDSVIMDLNQILTLDHEFTEAMERVHFLALVDDIRIAIANLIQSSGLELSCDFSQVEHIHCFKSYLHSIFYNLILNSIKYRRADTMATLHISSALDNGKLSLSFSDNGMGIDIDKYGGQLFGLYKRFHPGIEGKGVGLYMVKMQVEKLGGAITVESRVGNGTTFTILFEGPQLPG